jgi:hypothetical protein
MPNPLPENFPEPQIKRISTKTIGASLLAILNLERGIFYTTWEMIRNPGAAMRRYLFTDRGGFIEPLKFLVLTIPIYLFLTFTFFPDSGFIAGFENGLTQAKDGVSNPEQEALVKTLLLLFKEYANLILLITVPITALFTRLIFRKYGLYFGEHLVLNAFLYGFLTFVTILLLPLAWVSDTLNAWLTLILYFYYTTFFLRSFFQFSWWRAFGNSALIYLYSIFTTAIIFLLFMGIGFWILKS